MFLFRKIINYIVALLLQAHFWTRNPEELSQRDCVQGRLFNTVCGHWELELTLVSFTGTMDKSSRRLHSIESYATTGGILKKMSMHMQYGSILKHNYKWKYKREWDLKHNAIVQILRTNSNLLNTKQWEICKDICTYQKHWCLCEGERNGNEDFEVRRKNNEVREGSCRNDEMVCYKMRCRIIADLCPCGQKRRIKEWL